MESAPFKIKKLSLDSARMRVRSHTILGPAPPPSPTEPEPTDEDFPGYFVVSTAPPNIEDAEPTTADSLAQARGGLEAIARDLHRIQCDPTIAEPAELVIAVHGYNTLETNVQAWYSDMYRYIAQTDPAIRHRRNLVFVGYRWSSERLSARPENLWKNLRALPDVPQAILGIGAAFVMLYWSWTLLYGPLSWLGRIPNLLVQACFSAGIASTMVILTLLILRISGYFRDVYRAINFGVPDLTELIRQIDRAIINERVEDLHESYDSPEDAIQEAKKAHQKPPQKIQLNFLGHSMGGLVITNVVRILSDVFDTRSINQTPSPEIGYTLSLGRLILASPDIPVLSIISSRANGLASSLRRFNEAYLFSNEGDLALRLASTAANYISFPSGRQQHGHRLGSVALINSLYNHSGFFQLDVLQKGIINLSALQQHCVRDNSLSEAITADPNDILKCLFITHSSGKGDGYLSLDELFKIEHKAQQAPATLADLFTFFDCTDYKDYKWELSPNGRRELSKGKVGLLTRAKEKKNLALWDYIELVIDSLLGRRDVHGGYFQGDYSRQLIYRIAFLGMEGALKAGASEQTLAPKTAPQTPVAQSLEPSSCAQNKGAGDMTSALDTFNSHCMEKGIQVYLSPLRYRVDIQGEDIITAKEEIIAIMRKAPLVKPVEEVISEGEQSASGQSVVNQPVAGQSVADQSEGNQPTGKQSVPLANQRRPQLGSSPAGDRCRQ